MTNVIKVLIIDDSALIRQMLKEILTSVDDIDVVATASDPYIAREKIKHYNPDVLTLDVEMPRMNGLQFLSNLMRLRPMPVVMVSTLTEAGAPQTLEALEVGAVDYIAKPKAQDSREFLEFSHNLIDKVRIAAKAKVRPYFKKRPAPPALSKIKYRRTICVGSSTGGTEAITELLSDVPANCPPIVITQHIPASFSASFAMKLDRSMAMEVREAEDGLEVRPGRVIIAKGGFHLLFVKDGEQILCRLSGRDKVNRHRPSVAVMFDSLAGLIQPTQLVSVMLTGMGADGAESMKALHHHGAICFAQDESTSVVWGMPKVAYELGAVDELVPLQNMAERMLKAAQMR